MEAKLFLFIVFILTFLIVVAAIYVVRPSFLIRNDEYLDIDMWKAFLWAIVITFAWMAVISIMLPSISVDI